MPHWLIKSAAQRLISVLPASHKWNTLFQKHVTRSLDLTAGRFEVRLDHCRRHLDHLLESEPSCSRGFTVVELGTGWFPVVPVGLFLCGAGDIWTFDIAPLLSADRIKAMLARFQEYERSGALKAILPHVVPDRVARLGEISKRAEELSPEALLEELNIHVRVQDAQDTGLPAGTLDLFVSSGVLEYIPRQVLESILTEFKRAGSAHSIQSHYLNLLDQYSYFDASITPFNFLQYSEQRWKYLNSPLTWQNRLRISDYRELFVKCGFAISKELNTSGTSEDLRKIRLAPEFKKYSEADLLVLISWLVAKAEGNNSARTK